MVEVYNKVRGISPCVTQMKGESIGGGGGGGRGWLYARI